MFEIATSTPTVFLANITSQIADPGTLALIAVVFALPVTFWVIGRVKALLPKSK